MRGYIRKKTWRTAKGEERSCYEVLIYTGERTEKGNPRLASFTARTKKEAEAILKEKLAAQEQGGSLPARKVPLEAYITEHYLPYAKQNLRPTTLALVETIVKAHILPGVGKIYLDRLTPAMLNAFYRDLLAQGKSAYTVRKCHAILRRALGLAVRWRFLPHNPAANADPPAVPRKEMQVLDQEGVRRLLEAARGERLYPLFLLAVATGLRRAELCGLRWEDVDLENGVLYVRRALLVVNGKLLEGEPKSARSRRRITLPPSCVEALRAWRLQQKKERLMLGPEWEDTGYVFTQLDGNPLRPDLLVKRQFKALLRKAGLPENLRLHDLRHSHATALLAAGAPVKVVQERLGHHSAAFTLDVYGHLVPSIEREAAERIEAFIFGNGQEKEKRQG